MESREVIRRLEAADWQLVAIKAAITSSATRPAADA